MAHLLVLRPEPGAGVTIARARALGLEAVAAPLFRIEPLEWTAPDPGHFDGLLLTSANAIRCAGPQLQRYRDLDAHVVGEATAAAAREAGLTLRSTGNSGVGSLLRSIAPTKRLLHLCGEHRTEAAGARLSISSVIVYRSALIENPDLSLAPGNVVLIHSARAGKRFAELADERKRIGIVAISNAATAPMGTGWGSVSVAERPTDEALLALAARLCKNGHLG